MNRVGKVTVVMDIECYVDYFLVMFRRVDSDKSRFYEMFAGQPLDIHSLQTIMRDYCVVTFNGNNYDIPMLQKALTGVGCAELKKCSDKIIVGNLRGWQFEQLHGLERPRKWDHVDLIEPAFGQGSLKLYGGRLHSQKLQDLPIDPSASISPVQRDELRLYCANDLQTTIDLWNHLRPQIALREHMTIGHGEDLRSKSDAQIAESLIRKQVSAILGERVQKPTIPPGTSFVYQTPDWLRYTTPQLSAVLGDVAAAQFIVSPEGGVEMPATLDGRSVAIGGSVYRMGIGGLHSSEQNQALIADDEYLLVDRDVTSYYPAIILNCELSPLHLTRDDAFLRVYRSIVQRRVEAKRAGDSVVANALKIVANGSFGKLGSKYSALYSPHLMIQVTLTGQLALLMFIERLESVGIRVASGNTDGVVIHCRRDQQEQLEAAIAWWEKATGFNTEETRYAAVFSRDVNNYLAMKEGGGIKGKGAFSAVSISKNPQNTICTDAVIALLDKGAPIEETIRTCTDIRKFVTVRTVRGGGIQITRSSYDYSLTPSQQRDALLAAGWIQTVPGALKVARFARMTDEPDFDVPTAYRMHTGEDGIRYLGKVVRFYIGHTSIGPLHYMVKNKTGGRNKVPSSDGAVPVMELPTALPADIDYEFYIREARGILNDIGASPERIAKLHFGESADLFV